MVSFQCSPLSTPEGIVGTFKQCAQFQKDKDLESFVSVVVLDEVGLAEDSPRMPLKVNIISYFFRLLFCVLTLLIHVLNVKMTPYVVQYCKLGIWLQYFGRFCLKC